MWKAVLCVVLLAAMPAHAEVYKWTDSEGQVHYGDKPNDVSKVEEVTLDLDPSSGVALDDEGRDEKRQRLLDAMQEDRQEKEQQREKNRAEKEQRLRQCLALKDRLRRTQDANGLYQLDRQGNRVFLSNERRQESENKLQMQIRKYCN